MRLDIATVCTVLFAATGCKAVTLTADTVSNPVLFGPVRALGSHPMDDSVRIREFVSEADSSTTVVPMPIGPEPAETFIDMSGLVRMAVDVRDTMGKNEDLYIVMTAINCRTYFFYPLFFISDRTWCKATGTLFESPLPSIPRLVAKPQPKDGPRFDTKAARAALETSAAAASSCTSGVDPVEVQVTITFAASGKATSVEVGGDNAAKTPVDCIVKAFEGATVPAFEGEPVTVKKKVSLGKRKGDEPSPNPQ
jgi:hypothetical protein